MTWTKMNYRHSGWNNGYRYFTTWSRRRGLWSGDSGPLIRWLTEYYGPKSIEMLGPVTQTEMARVSAWYTPAVGFYPNPHWGMDTSKRRVYVTEETLMWARLLGKIS